MIPVNNQYPALTAELFLFMSETSVGKLNEKVLRKDYK